MQKQYIFNRRTLLGAAAATTTVGLLAACGGSKKEDKVKAPGKDAKSEELYNINSHPVSDLKQGGEVRIPLGSLGPDFNTYSTSGDSYDTQIVMSSIRAAGLWNITHLGKYELNKDFALSFKPVEEGGKDVVYIELNPKAKFNDGTLSITKRCSPPGRYARVPTVTTISSAQVSMSILRASKTTGVTLR